MVFNPSEHLMQLKSKEGPKDYLPVAWRLVWFREQFPQGTIDVDEVVVDLDREVEEEVYVWNRDKNRSEKIIKRAKGYARFKAIVTDGKGGRATGTKSENAASFPDYIEKAETGAIGRALAGLGYGTQFAPDLDEGDVRIVDAPVDRAHNQTDAGQTTPQPSADQQTSTPAQPAPGQSIANDPITEQQLSTIHNLTSKLFIPAAKDVEKMSCMAAKTYIQSLTAQLNVKLKNTRKAS
jgi:hypothetical protein